MIKTNNIKRETLSFYSTKVDTYVEMEPKCIFILLFRSSKIKITCHLKFKNRNPCVIIDYTLVL